MTVEILGISIITFIASCLKPVASEVIKDWYRKNAETKEKAQDQLRQRRKMCDHFCEGIRYERRQKKALDDWFGDDFFRSSLGRLVSIQGNHIRMIHRLDQDECCFLPFLKQKQKQKQEQLLQPLQDDTSLRESWAEHWAKELNKGEAWAELCDMDRRLILALLFQTCKSCFGRRGRVRSKSKKAFLESKKIIIHKVMTHCIVMERARALYCSEGSVGAELGRHWYCSEHHKDEMEATGHTNMYGGTMDKRFFWMMEFFEEDELFRNDAALQSWLEPARKLNLCNRQYSTKTLRASVVSTLIPLEIVAECQKL